MAEPRTNTNYIAREAYQHDGAPVTYEEDRFSGLMGRYRLRRQMQAFAKLASDLGPDATILDCPCGNGRWLPMLAPQAGTLLGADISESMLRYTRERFAGTGSPPHLFRTDATALPLGDDSVDWVFSFALFKHLPVPLQYRALAEYARVARRGVLVSLLVLTPLRYEIWRRRKWPAYPVPREELDWMAEPAGLSLTGLESCVTPIGLEHLARFEPA